MIEPVSSSFSYDTTRDAQSMKSHIGADLELIEGDGVDRDAMNSRWSMWGEWRRPRAAS